MYKTTFIIFLFCLQGLIANEAKIEFLKEGHTPLNGQVTAISNTHLTFTHPSFSEPVIFDRQKIKSLTFKKNITKTQKSSAIGKLELKPRFIQKHFPTSLINDVVRGNISAIDDKHILINTNFGGDIKLNKAFVKKLNILNFKSTIFDGTESLSHWEQPKGIRESIIEKDDSIYFERDQKLRLLTKKTTFPKKFEVEFSIGTKSHNTSYNIYLCADENGTTTVSKNAITVKVQAASLRVDRIVKRGRQQICYVGFNRDHNQPIATNHFRLFIDLEADKLSIFVNGKAEKLNQDMGIEDKSNFGSNLSFYIRGGVSELSIKKLLLKKWNGRLPNDPEQDKRPPLTNQTGKKIDLQNGDSLYGTIESIQDGIAKIKTKYGIFKLRLENISTLDIGKSTQNGIRMEENDALIYFTDGSRFILKLHDFSDGKVVGSGQAFEGNIEFPIEKIKKIEFQASIYPRTPFL